jgi:hypothetical protein
MSELPRESLRAPLRDAVAVSGVLFALIFVGSGSLRHLDHALLGYLAATVVATFATAYRVSAFWRRSPSAFYGRALLGALLEPRRWHTLASGTGRHLVAQEMIARRSRTRWLAHLLLSLGTLASFAITLPLVFGWLRFEAVDEATYRAICFTLPAFTFAIDGAVGFLVFHALSLAGVAVAVGAAYFIAQRFRRRHEPTVATGFHIAPLLLLLAVALTGLALPVSRGVPGAFRVAALAHELTVIVLLVALPFSKLGHVFLRPLQLGALVVRSDEVRATCAGCEAELAPAAQLAEVERILAARGMAFAAQHQHCPACRRRLVASAQATLLGADFQPRLAGVRALPPRRAEAA